GGSAISRQSDIELADRIVAIRIARGPGDIKRMPHQQRLSTDRRCNRYRRRMVLLDRRRRRRRCAAGNHVHYTGLAPGAGRTDRREWRRGEPVADMGSGYVPGRDRPAQPAVKLECWNLTPIHGPLPRSAVVHAGLDLYRGPGGQVAIPRYLRRTHLAQPAESIDRVAYPVAQRKESLARGNPGDASAAERAGVAAWTAVNGRGSAAGVEFPVANQAILGARQLRREVAGYVSRAASDVIHADIVQNAIQEISPTGAADSDGVGLVDGSR